MRILSLNGIKAVEVEEDKLGIPVTASYHIRVPPRHNAVFEVNIHAEMQGTQVITGNKHLLEKHPNMYQHEISIITEKDSKAVPLNAITNLDQVKTLQLAKGEVVGFARPELPNVTYIAMTNELNIEETVDVIPINWILKGKWNLKSQALRQPQESASEYGEDSQELQIIQEVTEVHMSNTTGKEMTLMFQQSPHKPGKDSWESLPEGVTNGFSVLRNTRDCSMGRSESLEHLQESLDQQWCDTSEVIESDFLILPGDIYPNRKVELEDTDIKKSTKVSFELLCEQQHEAF